MPLDVVNSFHLSSHMSSHRTPAFPDSRIYSNEIRSSESSERQKSFEEIMQAHLTFMRYISKKSYSLDQNRQLKVI